ncbi:MAG: hypothetical protein ACRD02_10295 [Acidimicrobiia bacterium]
MSDEGRPGLVTEEKVAAPPSPLPRPRSSPWPVATWLFALASALVLGVGVYGEVLAPSLVLDLVSFWPGLTLALLLAAALWPFRRRGPARLAAILPLLVLTWLWGGVALHLAQWELLPSAAADLEGPPGEGVEVARLSLEQSGRLSLLAADGPLYTVRLVRRGGPVGIPEAVERLEDGEATVSVVGISGGQWFRSSGWAAGLAPGPAWDLELRAATLDIDLRGLDLTRLEAEGSGVIRLPAVEAEVPIVVAGELVVEVPAEARVVVAGTAQVPEGWEVTDTGWRSPGREPGYAITVIDGSQVEIRET